VLVGGLMISRLRTPSLKRVHVAAPHVPFVLVGSVAVVAAVITYPWAMLLLISLGYLFALGWASWRRHAPHGG